MTLTASENDPAVQRWGHTMTRTPKETEEKPLYVRLSPALRRKVRDAAHKADVSIAKLVRETLELRFENQPADAPALSRREAELVREFTRLLLYEADCDRYMEPHIVAHLEDAENKAERSEAETNNLRRSRAK
jgi:hypothetical protein